MLFRKKAILDHEKKYWEQVAEKDLETIMEKICHNYTREDFENKKVSLIFGVKIKFDKHYTVLDLGCGIGRTCRWVAPFVKLYIGMDIIPKMIEKANEYNKKIDNKFFYTGNGTSIGLTENQIDICYSEIAFQHMDKDTQRNYINDLETIIKPTGKFYVQLPKKENYPVGWRLDEANKLFSNWDYTILNVSDTDYNPYYTIMATPNG